MHRKTDQYYYKRQATISKSDKYWESNIKKSNRVNWKFHSNINYSAFWVPWYNFRWVYLKWINFEMARKRMYNPFFFFSLPLFMRGRNKDKGLYSFVTYVGILLQVDDDTMVLIIEQFLMLILIIGRWMLPKVKLFSYNIV